MRGAKGAGSWEGQKVLELRLDREVRMRKGRAEKEKEERLETGCQGREEMGIEKERVNSAMELKHEHQREEERLTIPSMTRYWSC